MFKIIPQIKFIYFKNILIFLFPIIVFSQNAKEIAKKIIPSTVSIIMQDSKNENISLGSGFIVEGGIITNLHVVENSKFGHVIISGKKVKHEINGYLGYDKLNDLILLSVPSIRGLPINIKDKKFEIGEKVYAIGNPKGLDGTISDGIISGIRRFEQKDLIQITAPISPGSSGGPVLDNEGNLIGVSVGGFNSGQNLNFAIPINHVKNLIINSSNIIKELDFDVTEVVSKGNSFSKAPIKDSNIQWLGNNLIDSNYGNVKLLKGNLIFYDSNIISGKFIVDMTSITADNLTGKGKSNLEGHLKSTDFFNVNDFPISTLLIESAEKYGSNYNVKGILSIKNINKKINFILVQNGNLFKAKLIVDRTNYDIKYASKSFFDKLGDLAIDDEFTLLIEFKI